MTDIRYIELEEVDGNWVARNLSEESFKDIQGARVFIKDLPLNLQAGRRFLIGEIHSVVQVSPTEKQTLLSTLFDPPVVSVGRSTNRCSKCGELMAYVQPINQAVDSIRPKKSLEERCVSKRCNSLHEERRSSGQHCEKCRSAMVFVKMPSENVAIDGALLKRAAREELVCLICHPEPEKV